MKKTKKKTLLPTVIVTRDKENDLFLTLNENYLGFFVCETVEKAIGCAKENKISAMMILADNYPEKTVEISESEAKGIKDLGLRVYIEYPSLCEELGIVGYDGDACMGYSRGVAVSDTLGMEKNSIFYFHGAKYRVKSDISQALVVSARVAGYDIADYGVDDANPQVLLEYNSDKTLLIATTKLS